MLFLLHIYTGGPVGTCDWESPFSGNDEDIGLVNVLITLDRFGSESARNR